jgi:exodeoxyribonuclease III
MHLVQYWLHKELQKTNRIKNELRRVVAEMQRLFFIIAQKQIMATLKIFSYNVNGIRSAMTKGLLDWLVAEQPDIVGFQELKANAEDIDTAAFEAIGYQCTWFSAQKKGYSGVGIISKIAPTKIEKGNGQEQGDFEGRTLQFWINDLLIINTYFPSGSSGDDRQAYKMQFLAEYEQWLKGILKKNKKVIVMGDYNICHRAIDIHDPVGNKNSSGFLPEEREWMDSFFALGMTDSFRMHHPEEKHQYSWWSFRANARNNNKGWRIDYISASETVAKNISSSFIMPEAKHSDHCPIGIEINK